MRGYEREGDEFHTAQSLMDQLISFIEVGITNEDVVEISNEDVLIKTHLFNMINGTINCRNCIFLHIQIGPQVPKLT